MMDNRCPICGKVRQEQLERRSWTDKVGHDDGSSVENEDERSFFERIADFFRGERKSQPKIRTHFYAYRYFKCPDCNVRWNSDSDGMKIIEDYYAGSYRDFAPWKKYLLHIPLLPYYGLGIALGVNIIIVLIVLIIAFIVGFFYFLFADGHYFDEFFTLKWWPTLRWIASFVVMTWKYYAIYIPVVLLVFFLPVVLHNFRIIKQIDRKKKILVKRLDIQYNSNKAINNEK